MIIRKQLTEADARTAITEGEFAESVRASGENVAIVLTQHWCPQWTAMQHWLGKLERKNRPEDLDVEVYELEYDKVDYGSEFMRFKESVFGNSLIPYVRYYHNGDLIGETNFVGADRFLGYFGQKDS